MRLLHILLMQFFCSFFVVVSISLCDLVVVNDSLNGSTLGQIKGNGEFVDGGGWCSSGGKIIFDAGVVIVNGYFEAKMRSWTAPAQGVIKSHPLSGWEIKNQYTHHAQEGSFWNWRIGENYKAFKVLAASLSISDRQEARVGDSTAVNDGNQHTYRIEWVDGTTRFLFDGEELTGWIFPRFQLRYFTIGKDDQYDITDPAPIISDIQIVDRDAEPPNQPPGVDLPDLTVAEDDTLIIPRAQIEIYIQDTDDLFDDLNVLLEGDTVHFGWKYDAQNGLKIWPLPVHWNGTVDFTLTVIDSSGTLDADASILMVLPINDAPGSFDLLIPPDSTEFIKGQILGSATVKTATTDTMDFAWSSSKNNDLINGDQITYNFFFIEETDSANQTPLVSGLIDTVFKYDEIDTLNAGTYYWTVQAVDDSGVAVAAGQVWSVLIIEPTGIDEPSNNSLAEFYLEHNFPNPFNRNTTIRYVLPEKMNLMIKVYDVLNQEVRTLFHGEQKAGHWHVEWDGKDFYGRVVSSGIYVYRLITKERMISRKMLMIK